MLLRRIVKCLRFQAIMAMVAIAWLGAASVAAASDYRGQVTFSGLPLPGTTVTVTATQGSKQAVAISNDQGLFSFADLADGTWTLDIEMTGFAPVKQDVAVSPNAPMGTFEMKLLTLDQIRAAAKPVVVDATVAAAATPAAPEATPASPGAKTPADKTPATAAAAPGKTPAGKAATPGGTQQAAAAPEAPSAPSAAQDATAQQANDGFLINGSVNNAATSQFSMSQAFGNNRNGGRSLYNGGFSLILDSSSLDAKNFSITGLDSPKPTYNNLNAGFNVGGPLKIPHLLPASRAPYVYLYYQRVQRNNITTQQALVPTAAEWGGDLSQQPNVTAIFVPGDMATFSPGCNSALLNAGLTQSAINAGTAQFPGDVIPSGCISPVAQNLYKTNFYPAPNVAGNSRYNYQIPLTNSTHQDAFQASVQKQLGSKNNVNSRFGIQSTRSGNTSLLGFHDSSDSLGMNANVAGSHRFTQRLSMNASYNFSRSRSQGIPFFANRENISSLLGVSGNDQAAPYWAPPSMSFSSGLQGLFDGTSSYNRSETNSFTAYVNWNKFRHNIQAGGDFRRQEWNYLSESNPQGSLTFTGPGGATSGGSQAQGQGSDFADFLLGLPDTSAIAFGNADKYLRQSVYDLYANDDFRVNPELSINAGVRWEYGAPITELKGRLVNLDIAPGFTAEQPVLGSNPKGPLTGENYPSSLLRPDKIGVAPIVGIAWRPISGSSLLVRSGFGIYHDTSGYQGTASAMAQQAPLSTSLNIPNSPACRFNITNPFGALPCSTTTTDTFAVDPNFRVGYAQSWYVSAQRDMPAALQMVLTYSGIKGVRSVQEYLPNTCPPGSAACTSAPSGYVYRTSNGNSTREAGSIQLRRRLRNGFQGNLTYTFSKALDDAYALGGQGPSSSGTISQSGSSSGQVAQDWTHPNNQRGLSTFDQRHVLAVQLQYTTGMGMRGGTLLGGWRGLAYKEWSVVATINAASGLPETPIDPATISGTGDSGIVRANYLGGPIHLNAPGVFLNSAAFAAPAPGQWGNARRDSIEGPDQFNFNASMARTFHLHDRYNLDARIDANNVLNHVTYSGYVTTVGSPLFGTASAPNGMRSASITLRLRF